MGSPFSGSPYDNNVWRIYHLVTGHAVDEPPVEADLPVKPPVETIALWSPRDGIVSPRASCGRPGKRATGRLRCAVHARRLSQFARVYWRRAEKELDAS